jgi:hypothetical protein
MADNNTMKVNRYLKGYNTSTHQLIGNFIDASTLVDYDSEDFKYGLKYKSPQDNQYPDPTYFFQDPLFPAFDIVLDTFNSPLLIDEPSPQNLTYQKNSIMKFLWDYSDIYSIGRRQSVYDEFKKTLYTLFNTDFRQIDRNKSYYINSIAGLDKLTARIVEFEKDKITINLNEDVSMIAGYLSRLYNILSYSYKDQRQMIPANLLRFNMYIKIHDVRNMPIYLPDGTGTTISFEKSYEIYLLKDCMFDFKKSKNFDDTITVGGFDAGVQTKPSSISIDIVYKSIEIESEFPLIMNSFLDKKSSALKLNNKRQIVYFETGTTSDMNTNFINNGKFPDDFYGEIQSNGDLNNQTSTNISTTPNTTNKTSSQIGTNDDRKTALQGAPSYDVDKKGNQVYPSAASKNREAVIAFDPVKINTDAKGDFVFNSDAQDRRNTEMPQIPFRYLSSVFNGSWDFSSDGAFQHPQTGPSLQAWRDSLLGELNLWPFLYNLPFNIIRFFFGSYGGLPPMYINTYAGPLPTLDGEKINTESAPKLPLLGSIDTSYFTKKPIDGNINTNAPLPERLDGEFLPFALRPPVKLDGYKIPISIPGAEHLDGEFIPFAIRPPISLAGEYISFLIPLPEHLNGEFLPFALRPRLPLSGYIDMEIHPRPPLDVRIDTSFTPHPPVSGVIDTSFTPHPPVSGVIDTSFTPHPPVSGVIDTSFTPHPPVSGSIDTTASRDFIDVMYKYEKVSGNRNVDLGLLYVGVTKENIIPITYLYSKVDHFNSLENYYVFNNVVSQSKLLNDIRVDQTLREKSIFTSIYEYNNEVDVNKTLDNINLYNNNVQKSNNINFINVIENIPEKGIFGKTSLYQNTEEIMKSLDNQKIELTGKNKPIVTNLGNVIIGEETTGERVIFLGSITESTVAEKLLEPTKLFEPVKKKTIILPSLYENEKYTGNIFPKKLVEEKEFELGKNEMDIIRIDQTLKPEETLKEETTISIGEKKEKEKLNGDKIPEDKIKEKKGLDNERLR